MLHCSLICVGLPTAWPDDWLYVSGAVRKVIYPQWAGRQSWRPDGRISRLTPFRDMRWSKLAPMALLPTGRLPGELNCDKEWQIGLVTRGLK
jgi:hypothetical protein